MKIAGIYGSEAFIKSDNAVLSDNESFYCPEGCENGGVELRVGLAARINHVCKSVPAKHAGRFYEDVCLAFDFALKDKTGGAFAYAFDYSFAMGIRMKKDDESLKELSFSSHEGIRSLGSAEQCLSALDALIEEISKTMGLKVGDFVFLPLDKEVKELNIGQVYEVFAGKECVLHCEIK